MSDQTNQTTQAKPKTREEWESEVIGLLNSLAARKPITDEVVSLVDAIMSLQDEAERLREAAMAFAKAWATWHDHSAEMPDHEVIESASGIMEALGVDFEEDENGKNFIFEKARQPK